LQLSMKPTMMSRGPCKSRWDQLHRGSQHKYKVLQVVLSHWFKYKIKIKIFNFKGC